MAWTVALQELPLQIDGMDAGYAPKEQNETIFDIFMLQIRVAHVGLAFVYVSLSRLSTREVKGVACELHTQALLQYFGSSVRTRASQLIWSPQTVRDTSLQLDKWYELKTLPTLALSRTGSGGSKLF